MCSYGKINLTELTFEIRLRLKALLPDMVLLRVKNFNTKKTLHLTS